VLEKIMLHFVLLCCALLGDGGKPAQATTADRAAYEAAAAKAGNSAAAHVQLALWCETHGLSSERIKHLSIASSLDPSNVLARALLGLMAFQGKWAKPDQVEQEIRDNPKYQAIYREYLNRRVRAPQKNADAQLRLAAWCLENGLNDEAVAHYHLVTRLDPSRDIAWLKLGYERYHNRWSKADDLAAQKLEADRQKRADTLWKPRLEKLRDALASPTESRRLKAEKELYQITDPRAVPTIWRTFAGGSEKMQLVAVELFSQIEGPSASFCLVALAIEQPSSEVRARAARALAYRDPRDVLGWLTNLLRKPYKYKVVPANGPRSGSVLLVDGETFDRQRLYRFFDLNLSVVPVVRAQSQLFSPQAQFAINRLLQAQWSSLIGNAIEESSLVNENIQRTLENDVRSVDEANAHINETNGRSLALLEALTGEKLGDNLVAWKEWWSDQLGYSYNDSTSQSKPLYSDTVEQPDVAVMLPTVAFAPSCFAAGTLVQTIDGTKRIESLAIGDRVLSQNTSTGALSFQPVLKTTVRPGAKTFRITFEGETIVATGIHRFWKAGKGWTMARDLKAGDRLRMIGNAAAIQSIEPDAAQNVYNLSVAENANFFVGKAGALVHDVGFVEPVAEPFDRPASEVLSVPR
jgi:Pretoxin HINT domain